MTGSLPIKADSLYREIRVVLENARASAYRTVNSAMVGAYWQVGRLIVEHEQRGRRRAGYGEALLENLSARLTAEFGLGFTGTNLRYMRQFYRMFRSDHALRDESKTGSRRSAPVSGPEIRHAAGDESPSLRPELSWTHYRLLLGVEDRAAHGHVYLDGEPQKKFPGTFKGLSKGKHEIKVQAATHDHDHLAATDSITVEVQ